MSSPAQSLPTARCDTHRDRLKRLDCKYMRAGQRGNCVATGQKFMAQSEFAAIWRLAPGVPASDAPFKLIDFQAGWWTNRDQTGHWTLVAAVPSKKDISTGVTKASERHPPHSA